MAESSEPPEVNSALLSLVIIFIPGIICYGIISALAEKKSRDTTTMLMQIFMYGVFSYLLLAAAHGFYPRFFPSVNGISILNPSSIEKSPIDPKLIAFGSLFGALEGVFITLNLNYQWILKLLQKARITKRFGDEDVWTLLLNSTTTDNWVTVRYKERGLVYQGSVQGFSTGAESTRELMLASVYVYDADNMEKVGEIPFLYLSFEENAVTLEFGAKLTHHQVSWWRRIWHG